MVGRQAFPFLGRYLFKGRAVKLQWTTSFIFKAEAAKPADSSGTIFHLAKLSLLQDAEEGGLEKDLLDVLPLEVDGSMVGINGLFHLLIEGVYWDYNPLKLRTIY